MNPSNPETEMPAICSPKSDILSNRFCLSGCGIQPLVERRPPSTFVRKSRKPINTANYPAVVSDITNEPPLLIPRDPTMDAGDYQDHFQLQSSWEPTNQDVLLSLLDLEYPELLSSTCDLNDKNDLDALL